jgi:hypothetical protein
MMDGKKSRLLLKIILAGLLLALLAYLFHPDAGHLSLTINGAPVADPLTRVAALPAVLVILLLTAILTGLVILGVGGLLLLGLAFMGAVGIAIVIPYFWPVLAIVLLVMALASLERKQK